MASTLPNVSTDRHRVLSEMRPEPAKADLRKPETRAFWAEIGACLNAARNAAGWNLDELAHALNRDARQVRRWIAGEEQTQIAAVFGVEALRQPFVVELAKLSGCDVLTQIVVRRTA